MSKMTAKGFEYVHRVKRGSMFGVTFAYDDAHLKRLKAAPQMAQLAMEDAAFHWHTGILPSHFTRAAHGKYGYATRSVYWLKKKGANPDLVKTGGMKQELLSKAAARKSKQGVALTMTARALNFVPNSSNPLEPRIKRSDNKHYPNMKKEISEITQAEEKEIRNICEVRLAALFSTGSTEGAH